MIQIVDYGMGNIGSIINMCKKIGASAVAIDNPSNLSIDRKIILPGVGSFDNAMKKLNQNDWTAKLKSCAKSGTPLLGICLGMQLLATSSEEGSEHGIGLIPGTVRRFSVSPPLKVPHMGWNSVRGTDGNKLLDQLNENKFYFVHSYFFDPDDREHGIGFTDYGGEFVSMVNNKNVWGAQFHPEKSHRYGMQLLTNFVGLT